MTVDQVQALRTEVPAPSSARSAAASNAPGTPMDLKTIMDAVKAMISRDNVKVPDVVMEKSLIDQAIETTCPSNGYAKKPGGR